MLSIKNFVVKKKIIIRLLLSVNEENINVCKCDDIWVIKFLGCFNL